MCVHVGVQAHESMSVCMSVVYIFVIFLNEKKINS